MGDNSAIEWTEATWNPLTGCDKVSPGCAHCYAEALAPRLQAMGSKNYQNGFKLTLHPHMLDIPLRWRRPRLVFVNSMSDLFHPEVPLDYIQRVFGVMEQAHQHTFQVLTKRSERLAELRDELPWPRNVWMGVSLENQRFVSRVRDLQRVPAAVRFLSCEPLLGPLVLDLAGIHWVIVGGESGPQARPMHPDWVRGIRDVCGRARVPFFFKQWGEWAPASGVYPDDLPERLWSLDKDGGVWVRSRWVDTAGRFTQETRAEEAALMVPLGKRNSGAMLDGRSWHGRPFSR